MTEIKNAYQAILQRIETQNVIEVKQELCDHAKKLGIQDTYIIDELHADDSLTLEEIVDILEIETEEYPHIRKLVLALKANLRKRKLKTKPAINDAAIKAELAAIVE